MPPPSRIGRYRVTGELGRGAMGVVYRGVDDTLDRPVAVKVMSTGAGADEDSRARFKREAQAVARLQHPNIVTIYELGEHEGAPYMVLELLDGVDLHQAIEAGIRPDPKVTLPVVLQALAGLGHAHDHGIVHRDVKPSNVFLPVGRPAKIMDFGVARLGQAMTSTGLVVGTPNYMSPEQVRAAPLDGRSDLFSAGLILYELVTGEKAFHGDSVVSLMYKIAHEDPDLSLIPRGSEWSRLRAILEHALARDPDKRYYDADAMIGDLAQALVELGGSPEWTTATGLGRRARPVEATPTIGLGTAVPTLPTPVTMGTLPSESVSSAPAPPPPPATAAPPAAPQRALWWVTGGLAVAVVVLVGVLFTRPHVAAPSPAPAAPPSTSESPRAPSPSPMAAATPTPVAAASRPSATATPAPAVSTPPATRDPTTARVDKANDDLENRRYAQALAEARAVLQREPSNAEARTIAEEAEAGLVIEDAVARAREALKKGNKEEALEAVKRGLAVNGNEARLMALWREATQ